MHAGSQTKWKAATSRAKVRRVGPLNQTGGPVPSPLPSTQVEILSPRKAAEMITSDADTASDSSPFNSMRDIAVGVLQNSGGGCFVVCTGIFQRLHPAWGNMGGGPPDPLPGGWAEWRGGVPSVLGSKHQFSTPIFIPGSPSPLSPLPGVLCALCGSSSCPLCGGFFARPLLSAAFLSYNGKFFLPRRVSHLA